MINLALLLTPLGSALLRHMGYDMHRQDKLLLLTPLGSALLRQINPNIILGMFGDLLLTPLGSALLRPCFACSKPNNRTSPLTDPFGVSSIKTIQNNQNYEDSNHTLLLTPLGSALLRHTLPQEMHDLSNVPLTDPFGVSSIKTCIVVSQYQHLDQSSY